MGIASNNVRSLHSTAGSASFFPSWTGESYHSWDESATSGSARDAALDIRLYVHNLYLDIVATYIVSNTRHTKDPREWEEQRADKVRELF